ncbi:MAG: tyrosine-type recombinase/integrase [Elusimicrobia bacterium]|nr:tyrosine-type recombinase/integrase [Elusimicrobiota bacterium]
MATATKHRLKVDLSSFSPILKPYLRHLAVSGKPKGTIRTYGDTLSLFLGYFDGRDPAAISADEVDEFLEDVRKRRAPSTVNGMKSAIRGLYRYMLETDKIAKNPAALIRNEKVPRKAPEIFRDDQLRSLIGTIEAAIGQPPDPVAIRDWMLYSFLYNTGLRIDEGVHVDVADVEDKVTVQVIGKGSKVRWIPLNSEVRSNLQRYLDWRVLQKALDEKALFLNRFGRRLGVTTAQTHLKMWMKRAGIKQDFTPHTLRHTFATHALRAGGNIRVVQDLLGHANLSTTQIYTHTSPDEMRSVVEGLQKKKGG